jgi:hypothetical protein
VIFIFIDIGVDDYKSFETTDLAHRDGLVWSSDVMTLTRKTEELGENPSLCHFVHHRSQMDCPESESGPVRRSD